MRRQEVARISPRERAMKIRVRRDPFLGGCRLAERVLPDRTSEPFLTHFFIRAWGSAYELHATDTVVGLRLEGEAAVEQLGEALLPARQVLGILREVTADELTLDA